MEKVKSIKRIAKICIIIAILSVIGFVVYNNLNAPYRPIKYIKTVKYESSSIRYNNVSKYDGKIIKSYDDYQEFEKSYNVETNLTSEDFKENSYAIVFAVNNYCGGSINGVRNVKIQDEEVEISIGYNGSCGPCAPEHHLFIIPIEKDKINESTTVVSYKYIKENKYHCDPGVAYKPIIYLYPTKKTSVTVELLNKETLTTTYPKYQDKWEVVAKPNGDLIDKKTNRSLYGLYWEGKNYESAMQKEGFVIKGIDTIDFLEESLSKLGLTEREANEFIIYWLPKLEKNKYNYIHFSSEKTINKIMPLRVNPKPDTVIRVLMEYKPLDKKIKVKRQQLKTPQRQGFALVEWGGTEIN